MYGTPIKCLILVSLVNENLILRRLTLRILSRWCRKAINCNFHGKFIEMSRRGKVKIFTVKNLIYLMVASNDDTTVHDIVGKNEFYIRTNRIVNARKMGKMINQRKIISAIFMEWENYLYPGVYLLSDGTCSNINSNANWQAAIT